MPAHGSADTIGRRRDSNGNPITPLLGRASRLVDFVAKAAAGDDRLPCWVIKYVARTAGMMQHNAARLGHVTYVANHHVLLVNEPAGSSHKQVYRDSTDVSAQRRPTQDECRGKKALERGRGETSHTTPLAWPAGHAQDGTPCRNRRRGRSMPPPPPCTAWRPAGELLLCSTSTRRGSSTRPTWRGGFLTETCSPPLDRLPRKGLTGYATDLLGEPETGHF